MPSATARFFDTMAPQYDTLEPWYEHLYAELHTRLDETLGPPPRGARAAGETGRAIRRAALRAPRPAGATPRRGLDAGCGTGFQAARLGALGYAVHGTDLSAGLLRVAHRRLPGAALTRADVSALPYRDAIFDVATCCGSTLNLVDDPPRALAELGRVLRPGGALLLECEHAWSLDLAWTLASSLVGDPLGYGLSRRAAWRLLVRPPGRGCWLAYPGYPRLRLFARSELSRWLRAAGLEPLRVWGIHSITNLIPSTLLHRSGLGPRLLRVYGLLRAVDRWLAGAAPACALANHLVILARRRTPGAAAPGEP